ncbi:putative exported protein [Polaromonas sp. CG9_12]|nr:putative exported protein [Polaromonas sp. CG9_12]
MNSPVFSAQALLRRRSLLGLGALSALAVSGVSRRVWAQPAPGDGKTLPGGGRLVVVFLRGACDGLSAFVPYADPDYYAIRPNIAIAAPDGTAQSALRLDSTFALHPALSPLLPLWQQGVLGFVPAAGLPAPNRSHFDAQYQMEIARTGKTSSSPGWLNTVAELNARSGKAGGTSGDGSAVAIGVGEANPVILGGPAAVRLIARGQTAEKTGVLANDKTRQALLDLYGGNDSLSVAFRQGAGSRMQSAQELTSEKMLEDARRDMSMREAQRLPARSSLDRDGTPANPQMQSAQMLAASNGAADPVGLQLDAQHLGTLMRNDRKLRLGFLSAGGWDTHANQGAATGQLANNLGNLGRGIAQLRQVFSEPGDVIVVMSEFGRTSSENGTRGTDHGFGNALWLIGNSVAGGRWHGEWTGLAHGNLNEGRDLPAHHDYRAVLAQVLRSTFALGDSQLASVLPNSSWDHRLDGLLKKA